MNVRMPDMMPTMIHSTNPKIDPSDVSSPMTVPTASGAKKPSAIHQTELGSCSRVIL